MGWVCEQRHRYVSFFFPFFSLPYTFIRHILYVRSLGYKKKKKKRVRLSPALQELTNVENLDTQRNDKKSLHIVEQMRYLSEFVKTSQKNWHSGIWSEEVREKKPFQVKR